MDLVSDIMYEAARSVLQRTALTSADLDDAIAIVMQAANKDVALKRKFNYMATDKAYISKAAGAVTVIKDVHKLEKINLNIPMPSVARIRERKSKLRVDHLLPSHVVEAFNENYSKSIDITFTHGLYHDHPEAAASRKIETEVVMMMLREKGADVLRAPLYGYDMSVSDVGGDWRYHHVRKHIGVHTDAPFLDARDQSRDTRKMMSLCEDVDNRRYVCRHKMQDCKITSPFMMAIHSVLYTMPIVEICKAMATRGTKLFIGTMQLPLDIDVLDGVYVDNLYGYTVSMLEPSDEVVAKYIPPALRSGTYKYLLQSNVPKFVYKYPKGMSMEYVHDRSVIVEKLKPAVYTVESLDGTELQYKYEIIKRVGSLVYAQISLITRQELAHIVQVEPIHSDYQDGYAVTFDHNLVKNFMIRVGRSKEMIVPRQLFTTVAAYCLTKVRDQEFSIENAISYGYSCASKYDANGVILHAGTSTSDPSVIVVASIASFFWAFDRYRLIEYRIPQLAASDARLQVEGTIKSAVTNYIGVSHILTAAKALISKGVNAAMTDYVLTTGTSYADIRALYEKLSAVTSPGILKIRDLSECYIPIRFVTRSEQFVNKRRVRLTVPHFPPTQLVYELEINAKVKAICDFGETVRDGTNQQTEVQYADSIYTGTTAAEGVVNVTSNAIKRTIMDSIFLRESQELELQQTAVEIYGRVFDPETRDVRDMEMLKGTIKGKPTLLYQFGDKLIKIFTLEAVYHIGTEEYDTKLSQLVGSRFIYPEQTADGVKFGTCVLKSELYLRSDRGYSTANQYFTALLAPDIRVMNASRLRTLRKQIDDAEIEEYPYAVLANECAGSGKTHDQCVRYKQAYQSGSTAAIFASTKAAVGQVLQRLSAWDVDVAEHSVSTVDSFLMNPDNWRQYDAVFIDEALQLHAGFILAISTITQAKMIRGYGDRKQIGFINRARFHNPSVDTDFKWAEEQTNLVTRRIPNDSLIVNWLRHENFYGKNFTSLSSRTQAVCMYAAFSSLEDKLNIHNLYWLLGLSASEHLMILVYTQDEVMRVRASLNLTRKFVDEQVEYNTCACTIGEAQGEDVDNVLVLRLSTKAEPLYTSLSQTTVALTRHKKRWAYLAVTSQFPTLIEELAGIPPVYASFSGASLDRRDIIVVEDNVN
ncbi:MAG: replicase polyprotein (domains: methyltransferase, RdRP) [Plant associated virga-like virus 2]|nr:MAG: replicase polyprotein (domains: methyltransferase, RdRP) [Plant associated virga-like virus 2]